MRKRSGDTGEATLRERGGGVMTAQRKDPALPDGGDRDLIQPGGEWREDLRPDMM